MQRGTEGTALPAGGFGHVWTGGGVSWSCCRRLRLSSTLHTTTLHFPLSYLHTTRILLLVPIHPTLLPPPALQPHTPSLTHTGSERRVIPITGGRFHGEISGQVLDLGFDALSFQSDQTAK